MNDREEEIDRTENYRKDSMSTNTMNSQIADYKTSVHVYSIILHTFQYIYIQCSGLGMYRPTDLRVSHLHIMVKNQMLNGHMGLYCGYLQLVFVLLLCPGYNVL